MGRYTSRGTPGCDAFGSQCAVGEKEERAGGFFPVVLRRPLTFL